MTRATSDFLNRRRRSEEEVRAGKVVHEDAGTPYRPSNGSEGDGFMAEWCANCTKDHGALDGEGCPIIARTMAYSVSDPDYPKDWTHDESGNPVCTSFERAKAEGTTP